MRFGDDSPSLPDIDIGFDDERDVRFLEARAGAELDF
jgi:hypothetical protein